MLEPNGLYNTGSICYFNSLLQSIAACTSIYNYPFDKQLYTDLEKCFMEFITQLRQKKMSLDISNKLLNSLRTNNFGNGQESACEAFILLINRLNNKGLNGKFLNRFRSTNECISCKNITYDVDHAITINYFFYTEVSVKNLLLYKTIVKDYKCEKCNNNGITRTCKLTMLSEILIITFNIFYNKIKYNWPLELILPQSKLHYNIVGQIEHFGNLNGGHYRARGLRSGGVYEFDDSNVKPSKFEPTINTYIIVYHLKDKFPVL